MGQVVMLHTDCYVWFTPSVRATREQKAVEESQSELGMRVLALQAELLEKTSIIQQLTNTVERLEKEKQLQKTTELQGKGNNMS